MLACYGQGEPTDNAKPFYDFVMAKERKQGSLKDVRYTVPSILSLCVWLARRAHLDVVVV